MNKGTKLFYENRNICTKKDQLDTNDLNAVVASLCKNINLASEDIQEKISNLDKRYPTRKYFLDFFRKIFTSNSVCAVEYWLQRGHSEEYAKEQVKYQQSARSKVSINYWLNKGYSQEDAKTSVAIEQSKRSKAAYSTRDDLYRKQKSIRCVEYWTKRGYSEEDAIEQVKLIQSYYGKKAKGKIPAHKQNTKLEYYINLGYSEDSEAALSNRQNTFSLRKCIEKYGEEIGKFIFDQRQTKWQNTLNSKTPEELSVINSKKSNRSNFININELKSEPGIFYIIKIAENKIKIGITSKKTVYNRYSREELLDCDILMSKSTNLYNSFLYEQHIKSILKSNKIEKADQIKNFGYTETFIVDDAALSEILEMMKNDISFFEENFRNNEEFIYGVDKKGRKNI